MLDDSDVFYLQVSEESYEAAIISIVSNNGISIFASEERQGKHGGTYSNPQVGDLYFHRCEAYDYFVQAAIEDLTACFGFVSL